MSHVVQLEAFESPLKTRRIRWFILPNAPIAYPPGFQEQLFLEPPMFSRRILLTSHASSEAWKMLDRWDSVLAPSTPSDWSVVLAVVINQPPPCLVVLTPELKVPPAFYTKLLTLGVKAPTVVQLAYLTLPAPLAPVTFDCTFFPPSKVMDDPVLEATQMVLQQLMSSNALRDFVLKDAIRDLKGAGATIVVSSIGDPEPTMYWYYASETNSKTNTILASVVQTLLRRDI